MSRRFAKRLAPLLVALVALILGFLAMGTSFADETAGTPGKGGPQISQPKQNGVGAGAPATGQHGCSNCMGHDR